MNARKRHIISIQLQNEVGALTRLTSLFATRGYNIECLNVAPTADATISRLTLVTTGTDAMIQHLLNQSLQLIDVISVADLTRDQHVERELLLIKLKVAPAQLETLRNCALASGAKVLSDDPANFTLELSDRESQLNHFITAVGAHGEVLEIVRSGALAILCGSTKLHS